jgi:predicted nucleic acid-binding protein
MIALDTSVIFELNKPKPSDMVLSWFNDQLDDDLFLTDVTVMELAYGAEKHT